MSKKIESSANENDGSVSLLYYLKDKDPYLFNICKLRELAKYYNEDWMMTVGDNETIGYYVSLVVDPDGTTRYWVDSTTKVIPGVVYFKNKADALNAIKLIKPEAITDVKVVVDL